MPTPPDAPVWLTEVVAADGSSTWARVPVTPVLDPAGRVSHWVHAVADAPSEPRDAPAGDRAPPRPGSRRGLEALAEVSDLLVALDDELSLGDVADVLARDVVDWAAFYLDDRPASLASIVDDDAAPRWSSASAGPRADAGLRSDAAGPDLVRELLDGDRTGLVHVDLGALRDAAGPTGWLARRVAADGDVEGPVVVLPVPGRVRVLGLLVVVPHGGRTLASLEPSALTVLELTVRRVGLAIDNARLYAREHRLAEALQRAMLPDQVEVPGLDVWTHYAPGSGHAQVGGDWYDVLQIAPDLVGLVIGDVVGHDVEAAAAMGQLRSLVRSYAFETIDPGAVLERVDRIVAGMRIPRAAGLVLSTLHRRDAAWELAYSRAGHLPALLVRDGMARQLDAAGGTLIGFGDRPRETGRLLLAPGDVLVLYTDGLVERRDRALRDGVDALTAAAAQVTAIDAAGIGEELLARLADRPEDDLAVVVVRVPHPSDDPTTTPSPRSRRWRLPNEPGSVARARHAVLRTCRTWGLDVGTAAELVVSELVANAVLHGWGYVSLRLVASEGALRVEVEDGNPAPPVPTDGHESRIGGFGMQIVDRLAEWGWEPAGSGKVVWAVVRPGAPLGP